MCYNPLTFGFTGTFLVFLSKSSYSYPITFHMGQGTRWLQMALFIMYSLKTENFLGVFSFFVCFSFLGYIFEYLLCFQFLSL